MKLTRHVSRPAWTRPSMKLARQLLMAVEDVDSGANAILTRADVGGQGNHWRERIERIPIPQKKYVEIYRECIAVLDRHARTNTGLKPLSQSEYKLLCHCIITCSTVEDVISRASEFSQMIQNRAGKISLNVVGGKARFHMESSRARYDINAFFVDIVGLVSYYRLFGWLIGEDIEPISIEMRHNKFIDDDIVAQIIACGIKYSCESNVLQFPEKYLKYPIIRTPLELSNLLKNFPFDPMALQSRDYPISERIRLNFNTALAEGIPLPNAKILASQLSIGVTTLKRRLLEEGSSVKSIKERCRYELSLALLKDRRLTIGAISSRVGFSDITAFRRAFRGWTGFSPYKFRELMDIA